MNKYTLELLEELFNQFEEDEQGVYWFAGTDNNPVLVEPDVQYTLERIAKLLTDSDIDYEPLDE